jgi:steroid delta-isomerase-like uncharacterized protein
MTAAEIRSCCERFAGVLEGDDLTALGACYAIDCEVLSPIFHTLRGRAEVVSSWGELFKALTDRKIRVDDIVVDSGSRGRAVLIVTSRSIHRGEIFGMPGTGRAIETQVAFILTFDGGQITQERRIYDFTRLLMQLGVLRAKTA